jgi:hypothetical protein
MNPRSHRYGSKSLGRRKFRSGSGWAEPENCKLSKDLRLRPRFAARGPRLDLQRIGTLCTGLNLCDALHQTPAEEAREYLMLPQLWAALPADFQVTFEGPELLGLMHTLGASSGELANSHCRTLGETPLYPAAWVSHHWQSFTGMYADLNNLPAIQVIRAQPGKSLTGHRAVAEFDFAADPFRIVEPLLSETSNVHVGSRRSSSAGF